MNNSIFTHIKYGLFALLLIIIIGTLGYEYIEDEWSFLDSLYMTVISISTTGFKEVRVLSTEGRIFTIFIIISGVLALAYTGGKAAQIMIERQIFRRRKMHKLIEKISDHHIICGFGRMGSRICESLYSKGERFVVIENDPEKIELLVDTGYLFINGDATNDDILLSAGIKKARGLVSVIKSDAENVFATLSAKELAPEIFVIARAVEEGTESKLMKAGADKVVKPYELSVGKIIQILINPGISDFLEGIVKNEELEINLEEIKINQGSDLVGKKLIDSPTRKELDIIIVAIRREDDSFIYNPKSDTIFKENDILFAIGKAGSLRKFSKLCG